MRLVSTGDGHWVSEDGRVEVIHDHTFETECDEPHPVRMRLDKLSTYSDWYAKSLRERGTVKTRRTKEGWVEYLTYQCEGNETHFYSMWTVMIDGDWTNDVYERLSEAINAVEKDTGSKVTLVRKKSEEGLAENAKTCHTESVSDERNQMTETTEKHAVYATTPDHETYRVSDPLDWDAAQSYWRNLDEAQRAGRLPHVKFFEVRSVTLGPDRPLVGPEIRSHGRYDKAPLVMHYATPVVENSRGYGERKPGSTIYSAKQNAARDAWHRFVPEPRGKKQGSGGWFYWANGQPAAQGLYSLADVCERKSLIVKGADGRWYVLDWNSIIEQAAPVAV